MRAMFNFRKNLLKVLDERLASMSHKKQGDEDDLFWKLVASELKKWTRSFTTVSYKTKIMKIMVSEVEIASKGIFQPEVNNLFQNMKRLCNNMQKYIQ